MPRPLDLFLAMVLAMALALVAGCRPPAQEPAVLPVASEQVAELDADLAAAWRAAVASVHAIGLAVPPSAELTDAGGRIDVDDLRLRLEPLPDGRTRVGARFLGFPIDERERQASALLADLRRRLR